MVFFEDNKATYFILKICIIRILILTDIGSIVYTKILFSFLKTVDSKRTFSMGLIQ